MYGYVGYMSIYKRKLEKCLRDQRGKQKGNSSPPLSCLFAIDYCTWSFGTFKSVCLSKLRLVVDFSLATKKTLKLGSGS